MAQLAADQMTLLVTLCESFCQTENDRRVLLDDVFLNPRTKPHIDLGGTVDEFVHRVIYRLIDYGEIEPDRPALWALLEVICPQVAEAQQTQIESLKQAVFDASAPAADYIVATQGAPHIFISYATANAAFADQLRADLSAAGLNLWIDRIGLKVGTPNWEDAIRDALKRADSVLLIASPISRKSNYVRDELAIARDNGKPVYPVWVDGDVWSESIPMGLGYTQYVDLRADKYAEGVKKLVEALGGKLSIQEAFTSLENTAAKPVISKKRTFDPQFVPRNPYKGLSAFRYNDRGDFFGREMFITDLTEHLRSSPSFLAVIGASGSGKSSVVMAGLLPRLREQGILPGSSDWVYLDPFVPGKRPIEALSIVLAKQMPQKAQAAIDEDLLHPSTRGLYRLAKQITQTRLVVYIDQFEELFTLTERDEERRQFIDLLTTAVNESESIVTIILTLRADFYDRPLQYGELGRLVQAHNHAILPLSLADLYEVILEPAAQEDVSLTFEPGLVEEMVFSVKGEAGALPLLQFTLDQLFQRRSGLTLLRGTYDEIGGVRGALAKHAEETFQTLDQEGQKLARGLFLRLIEPGLTAQETTRRRARMTELKLYDGAKSAYLQKVADIFVHARLLTADSEENEDTIEVSHEALIREWERLKNWLDESRDDVALMQRISNDAEEWLQKAQPEDALYRGRRLREALDWARNNTASAIESAFISASENAEKVQIAAEDQRQHALLTAADRAEQQARLARRATAVASVIIILAIIAGLYATTRINEGDQRAAAADAQLLQATTTLAYVQDQGTQVAQRADYLRIEQAWTGTLAAGAVVIPPGTLTPELLIPTLTGVARLQEWEPHIIVEEINGVEVEMVLVPPGCFMMGSVAGGNEVPIVEQCFDDVFYIDRYEVTQAQFHGLNGTMNKTAAFRGDQRPVENINWFEARDFCLERRGARLPTEREWEYAARGPNSLIYAWGDRFIEQVVIQSRTAAQGTADVVDASGNPARPAGASWVGAVDFGGNVNEWTSTRYDDLDFSNNLFDLQGQFPYPYRADDGRETDETLETYNLRIEQDNLHTLRVYRGGSWGASAAGVRASARNWDFAISQGDRYGFRCARSA